MMDDPDYTPYSSPIPIAGTSYSAQIGKSKASNKWKIRLIKGRNVTGSEEFDELNGNLMIAFIMRETAIPMLNPYKISQNIKMLIKQAERGPLTEKPLPPSPPPMPTTTTTPAARASEYDVPKRTAPAPISISSAGKGPLQDAINQLSEIVSMLQQTIQLLQDALRASQ
ncbi:MAG: hypothetical protein EAX96_08300 [Candidatus Lokiarchaeota archaeon]|nr:hypothetical protein [Candidatus Lokiarchaeota archaeon]